MNQRASVCRFIALGHEESRVLIHLLSLDFLKVLSFLHSLSAFKTVKLSLVHNLTQDLALPRVAEQCRATQNCEHENTYALLRDAGLRVNRKYFYFCVAPRSASCVGPIRFKQSIM